MIDPTHNFLLQVELRHIANAVLLLGFIVSVAGELALPMPGYRWNRARFVHGAWNLVLWLVGIAAMSIVFGSSVWLLLQLLQFYGVGLLYLVRLPFWLHAIAAFVLFDAADYMFHRMSHNVRWLWLMHAVHHSDSRVDVTTNLRQHPLHIIATQLWKLVAYAAIGVPAWVFLVHEIVNLAFAYWHHSAIRWPQFIDRACAWLIITPRLHWNHHSPSVERTNSNYGVILSIWDRAFGTMTPPIASEPLFGLASLSAESWHNVWGMLATPWRARMLRQL